MSCFHIYHVPHLLNSTSPHSLSSEALIYTKPYMIISPLTIWHILGGHGLDATIWALPNILEAVQVHTHVIESKVLFLEYLTFVPILCGSYMIMHGDCGASLDNTLFSGTLSEWHRDSLLLTFSNSMAGKVPKPWTLEPAAEFFPKVRRPDDHTMTCRCNHHRLPPMLPQIERIARKAHS